MKQIILKNELRDLVLAEISTDDLNENYDYSGITDMSQMFENSSSLKSVPLFIGICTIILYIKCNRYAQDV